MGKPTQRSRNDRPYHNKESMAEIVGVEKVLPIDSALRPNPWNPNVQSKASFEKLTESIRRFGFSQRVVVRPFEGGYQIIDGEHRWRAAQTLRMTEVPAVDVGDVSDETAKQLTIIFNELSGSPDQVRLAELLRDLSETVPLEDLRAVMPFPDREIDVLISAVDFTFDNLPEIGPAIQAADDEPGEAAAAEVVAAKDNGPTGKVKQLKFQLTPELHAEMETKLAEIGRDPNVTITRAIRTHHKEEMKKRRERKAKAKTTVKKLKAKEALAKEAADAESN